MDDTVPRKRLSKGHSSKIAPINTTSLLDQQSPTQSAHFPESAGERVSFQSHGRAMSSVGSSTRPNRFSVSFPVHSQEFTSPTRYSHSPTRDAPPVIPESLASPTGPTDTNFLTAIATQERRVMELKEELQRAEADLNKLKRQWGQYEASKKRNDAQHVTKLQSLQTALHIAGEEHDESGSNAWMQQEMERRKALLNTNRNPSTPRTIFSGSRHTRTLSLLSPLTTATTTTTTNLNPKPTDGIPTPRPTLPPRKESLQASRRSLDHRGPRPLLPSRSSTAASDLTAEVINPSIDTSPDHELLLRTGKKLATDLKDGLWTFWEDLRQATVGEDAAMLIPPPHLRRQSSSLATVRTARKIGSRSSLRSMEQERRESADDTSKLPRRDSKKPPPPQHKMSQYLLPDLADASFWSEHGVGHISPAVVKKTPTSRRQQQTKSSSKPPSETSNDAWDTWGDSPDTTTSKTPTYTNSRSSSSTTSESTATLPSTASVTTSPRISTDNALPPPNLHLVDSSAARDSKRDSKSPIPWPSLSKLGPATLRRTASHLMSEWEKSLMPSPGQEFKGEEDYLGLIAGRGKGGREGSSMERSRKVD